MTGSEESIKKVLENLNIQALNSMQQAAIGAAQQNDVVLLSPTGSGKTLAFLIPVLQRLLASTSGVQALVLVPSRELALQIEQVFRQMSTGFKVLCSYGGHPTYIEKNSLVEPPALLIGTPGRIAYHLRHQNIDPSTIHTLVLDEFDKALELGFQEDMSFIINQLTGMQRRVLTSATRMSAIPEFTGINHPQELDFLSETTSAPDLLLKAVRSESTEKPETLFSLICKIGNKATLVFCNHREAVERISELLWNRGLEHDIFHGGMEQPDRERALLKFRNGSHRLLITTDLASRGLDIPEIEYIIHYQLPPSQEAFTHRNGRTARMHAKGTAYLILTDDEVPAYLPQELDYEELPEQDLLPPPTEWSTLYIGAGKKDKVNKIDIVGLLLQKGNLKKEELGLIEVQDHTSFVAVRREKIKQVVQLLRNEKIKGKRVKIDISK
ncbi:DEAD/DEAH box helicase [Telluribacter sp. SYSU D00476]|uniref:DEAD/DEAH box helicase n=1 Tax=Telluribacter sp. SYSU D00476 TaxID=2811430 RepID=UPI001FF3F638|nr:DEAD/DEAH box helicase [Telluribacter sp. SYSU D00476]